MTKVPTPSKDTARALDSAQPSGASAPEGAYLRLVPLDREADAQAILLVGTAVLGRRGGGEASVALPDERVSRAHLRLSRTSAGWVAEDLGSRNGTFVEGRRLRAGRPTRLEDGAVLRVGDHLLVFRRGAPAASESDPLLPGVAPALVDARQRLRRVAPSGLPVLLVGATGTGKEFAARALHRDGRPEGTFVPVNTGELAKSVGRAELFGAARGAFTDAREARTGLVEHAAGGTLFLDEIGDLAAEVQVDLLRFLDDGTFRRVGDTALRRSSARVVAATNVDLPRAVEEGRFRRDLYGRLVSAVPPVELPRLTSRREDLVAWAHRFADERGRALGLPRPTFSAGFAEAILLYGWPENLRSLAAAVSAALLSAEGVDEASLEASHLPESIRAARAAARDEPPELLPAPTPPAPPIIDATELEAALRGAGGNVRRASERLGVDRRKLYRLLEQHGVDPARFR
jgi:DNA-binding NtrC family response regulator